MELIVDIKLYLNLHRLCYKYVSKEGCLKYNCTIVSQGACVPLKKQTATIKLTHTSEL